MWEEEISRCFHPFGEVSGEAELVLRQISDDRFELVSGFTYSCDGSEPIHLAPGSLSSTDLASVPRPLNWMVGNYGRHTFAALLHDALQQGVADTDIVLPSDSWEFNVEIDAIFLSALKGLGVPTLLSNLMWAAVRISSRWQSNGTRKTLTLLWASAALAGIALMMWGVATARWEAVLIALGLPVVGAALWGKDFKAGAFAGYGAVFVAGPTALVWCSGMVYRVLQRIVGRWIR